MNLLMAYALNLDPQQNLRGSMPLPVLAAQQMSLTFYAASAGVAYTVETSTNLRTWTTTDVILSDPDANNFRTATVALPSDTGFMRLVVEVP